MTLPIYCGLVTKLHSDLDQFVLETKAATRYGFVDPDDESMIQSLVHLLKLGTRRAIDAERTAAHNEVQFPRASSDGTGRRSLDAETQDIVHLPTALADVFGVSRSEARRLISQGAVRVDGEVVTDLDVPRDRIAAKPIRIGRRREGSLDSAKTRQL